MSRVVGRKTNRDPVARNHTDPKSTHSTRKLRGHDLTRVEGDLVSPSSQDLVDFPRGLDQIISRQCACSVLTGEPVPVASGRFRPKRPDRRAQLSTGPLGRRGSHLGPKVRIASTHTGPLLACSPPRRGGGARLNVPDSKSGVGASLPWVRIPPSPPSPSSGRPNRTRRTQPLGANKAELK